MINARQCVNANPKMGQLVVMSAFQSLRPNPELEPVSVPGQVEDSHMVNDPVDQGQGHCGLSKNVRPSTESQVLVRISDACTYR